MGSEQFIHRNLVLENKWIIANKGLNLKRLLYNSKILITVHHIRVNNSVQWKTLRFEKSAQYDPRDEEKGRDKIVVIQLFVLHLSVFMKVCISAVTIIT